VRLRVWSTWIQALLALAVSAVFLYLFLQGLDYHAVLTGIEDANYALVPFALALFAASLVARAYRWQVFYRPEHATFRLLFPTLLITYAGNNLFPLRGGELLRAQLLRNLGGIARTRTIGAALIERLFDLLMMGACVVAGRLVVDTGAAFFGTGLAIIAASLFGFGIAWAATRRIDLIDRLVSFPLLPLKASWRKELQSWGRQAVVGFGVMASGRSFVLAWVWTLVAWTLEFGMYWLVARAFHLDEGFLTIAFVGASANLALSIPSAQGGVGPFQLVAKEALLRFGIASADAAAFALILHVLIIVPVTLVGVVVFFKLLHGNRTLLTQAIALEDRDEPDAALGSACLPSE
jgi:uncharacterized protein (TIRG00374 family)